MPALNWIKPRAPEAVGPMFDWRTVPLPSRETPGRPASPASMVAAMLVCAAMALTSAAAPAQVQQTPSQILSPAQSDPELMQWMQGSPPVPDKRIMFEDGSFGRFPQTRWSFAHYRELFRTARVARGSVAPSRFPVALRGDLDAVAFMPIGAGQPMTWGQAFQSVYGDAVLVLHKGGIVFERYNGVMNRDQPHIAFSVTKSFVGTLAEMLVEEGRIDERAPVSRYLPELASSGFGDATVRQVLDMTSGLDFSENYTDPKAQVVQYAIAAGAAPRPTGYDGPRNTFDFLKTVGKAGRHGDMFAYRSVNTEVLGLIIARVTGARLQDVLSKRIWSRLGMDHDADWVVDSTGMPLAAGGLNLTLRDLARFAEMMRLGGRFNGRQVVPASVVARIRAGASQADFAKAGYATLPGWSYRSQWWISHNAHGAFSARGIHGQTIYVDPVAEMVIVRFASNPMAANANFDPISLPAYQAIADRLLQSPKNESLGKRQ